MKELKKNSNQLLIKITSEYRKAASAEPKKIRRQSSKIFFINEFNSNKIFT